jgi:DNA-binding response OmpR family regulator
MYALLLSQNADETAILSLVLQRVGMAVTKENDPEHAVRLWPQRPTDFILLALNGDPLAHLGHFRAVTQVPIAVITDRLAEDIHYEILENGADLIIQRPYSARLLVAQLRALMRRSGGVPLFSLPILRLGGLVLDPAIRKVQVGNNPPRKLTHLEFRLLYTMMVHRDQILPTDTIVEQVWGYSGQGDKELVRGLVRRLRTKVELEPGNPQYILTEPGVGYSFHSHEE